MTSPVPDFWLLLVDVLITAASVPLWRRLASRLAVLDRPGERKSQPEPVPLLGGGAVAVGLGLVLIQGLGARPIAFSEPIAAGPSPWLLAGLALALITGTVDDLCRRGLPPWAKLTGLAIGGALAGIDPAIRAAGGGVADALLFVGWFMLVATAFNTSDNMNGLAAGLALVPAGALILGGVPAPLAPVAAGAGAGALGFLPSNYPRARIYLGDGGSHLLGACCAVVSCPLLVGWYGIALVAVPLLDLLFVSVLRLSIGARPWRGDQRHLSHQLVRLGVAPWGAVAILWTVAFLMLAAV